MGQHGDCACPGVVETLCSELLRQPQCAGGRSSAKAEIGSPERSDRRSVHLNINRLPRGYADDNLFKVSIVPPNGEVVGSVGAHHGDVPSVRLVACV